jgi:hypothetical protein
MAAAATRTALEWLCRQRWVVIRPRWRSAHDVCQSVLLLLLLTTPPTQHSTRCSSTVFAHTHTPHSLHTPRNWGMCTTVAIFVVESPQNDSSVPRNSSIQDTKNETTLRTRRYITECQCTAKSQSKSKVRWGRKERTLESVVAVL